MLKTYIWDLDGTLLDSYGAIVSSLVTVARECGAHDSYEKIMKAVKLGAVSTYLKELGAEYGREYPLLYQRYREISHEKLEEITLIPGARETLEGLAGRGAKHYVYTHRGKSTESLLKRLALADYFGEIITFEQGFQPKPSGEGVAYLVQKHGLEKADTAYVGDRLLDVRCAKNAGVKAILYRPEDSCVSPTGEEDLVIGRLEELLRELPHGDPRARKKELRRELLAKRDALAEEYQRSAGEKIQQRILQSEAYARARRVFVYVSVGSEPPTDGILRRALADGRQVYVPRCRGNRMEAARLRSMEELTPGRYGIPEPAEDAETAAREELDLVIVPCVAASRDGRRLGHGGGYYDRFLQEGANRAVCLCFQEMLREEIPEEAWDVRIPWVVTE